jgi:hypothetical protein
MISIYQVNQFRDQAKKLGKSDAEIDAFIYQKLKSQPQEQFTPRTIQPEGFAQVQPKAAPQHDGFLKSVAKGIASPFLKLGATAEALGTSKYLGGSGTDNSIKNTPLGPVKPITTGREAAGVGLELAGYAVGGGGAVGVGKGVAKGAVGQAIKQGVVQGAKAGALAGAGTGLQKENATAKSVLKDTAIGSIGGGLLGGAIAGIPGIAIGGYRAAREVKNFINPEATVALTKAIKPAAKYTNFVPELKAVLPDIQETASLTGTKINNLDTLSKVITVSKQRIWNTYERLLGPNAGATIDGNEIADSIMSGINKRFAAQNPAKVERITQIAETYRKPLSLHDAEEFLQDANNELHTYYAKNKVGQKAAAQDPEVAYVLREARALRNALYTRLEKLTGKNAAALKQKWGALSNIQNEVLRRSNVAARQNPESLAEQLSFASGVGKILKSAANTEFGDAISGAGQMVTSRYLKNKNTTDTLIETAFTKLSKKSSSALRSVRPKR